MSDIDVSGEDPRLPGLCEELRSRLDQNALLESLVREIALTRLVCRDLDRKVRSLQSAALIRDVVLPQVAESYRGITEVVVDGSLPLPAAQGFYHLEGDHRGLKFRWTGPGTEFYFDLHIDRAKPLQFRLRLAPVDKDARRELTCYSDEAEIPLRLTERDSLSEFSGTLFPREILGITRLRFKLPRTFVPTDGAGKVTDTRQLGVRFVDLSLGSVEPKAFQQLLEPPHLIQSAAGAAKDKGAASNRGSSLPGASNWSNGEATIEKDAALSSGSDSVEIPLPSPRPSDISGSPDAKENGVAEKEVRSQ